MKFMEYSFKYQQDGETWYTGGFGYTAAEALEHERFWWPELPALEELELVEEKEADQTELEAWREERILRRIFADKETYLRKIDGLRACPSDKAWLRRIVSSGNPQEYFYADTMVRDWIRSLVGAE